MDSAANDDAYFITERKRLLLIMGHQDSRNALTLENLLHLQR